MASATRPPEAKVPKLDGVNDEEDGEGEVEKVVTEEDQVQLEKVVAIQHEIDQLNERASEEILHVEQKYNKLRQPHYLKRSDAIAAIPDFWHTTLINNPQFADLLSGEDETALQYLTNLTVEEYEEPNSGYKISFHFRANPYFENEVLSKEVMMEGPGETTVTDTRVLWKEGKDITVRNSVGDSEVNGRKRVLEELPSFFSWFTADSGLEEPGEIIRDDIWPNPLQFFLDCSNSGALNETFDDEEEEEEEDEDDEDGLEEEEDEDDDPDVIDLSDDEDED